MSTTDLPKRYSPSVFNGVAGMIDNDQGGYVRFHDCVTYGTACAEAAKATGTACVTCNGTGLVDDGEIDHYPNGEPYMCGPVKCVKDCPDCTPVARQPAPVDGNDAFKEAYMEWSRKTDWVQEQIRTFPVNSLGMHRADVMREEIERLRAERKPASIVVKTWRERKAAYHLEVREAQPDAVFMALEIEDLRAALTRQKKEA